jgi:hypothetical protein
MPGQMPGENQGMQQQESKSLAYVRSKAGAPGKASIGQPNGADGPDASLSEGEPFDEEAWFADLPAEMRESIRTNSRLSPPAGYDQRIQEYFQNVAR